MRDLFRTEALVALAEGCCGEPIPNSIAKPSVRDHDTNIEAVIRHLGTKTRIEWGEDKLIKGVQSKQLGYLEILCWHLVEVGELKPLGLPIAEESLVNLAQAIEARLSKFIQLKQFHFRYTKEMIFDIVHDCSSWSPDKTKNDVQNLRSAFDNIEGWGIPALVDPQDIKSMGSVNERGFLIFFAFFIPSLEGIAGPKKKAVDQAPPPPVVQTVQIDVTPYEREIERLKQLLQKVEEERDAAKDDYIQAEQRVENLSGRCTELEAEMDRLRSSMNDSNKSNEALLSSLKSELSATKSALEQAEQKAAGLSQESAALSVDMLKRLEEVTSERDQLKHKIEAQDFDGLEARYQKLIAELFVTKTSLSNARNENDRVVRQLKALELKMPLYLRQGKNTVSPPVGDVTLVFTDVEGSTVQWEWDAESMAVAIRVHNDLMRAKLHEWSGYEVKTEGDAFMVAFADPLSAVNWCLDVQEKLLEASWPEKLYEHSKSKIVKSSASGNLLYKGLRVRMGIHNGKPSAEEDPVTGRMDYFGPMVNRAARVESVAHGGQIVMSSDVHDRVLDALRDSRWNPEVRDLGSFELKGLNDPTHIYQLLPSSLVERKFEAVVTKEAELAEEKKKLEEQLAELQKKNNELSEKLVGIDAEVKGQMDQAQRLLEEVQSARLLGSPPQEMLDVLKDQLQKLLRGQTLTASELQKAQVVNEELFKQANEAAERREQIAVQTMEAERLSLQAELGNYRSQLEDARNKSRELQQLIDRVNAEKSAFEDQARRSALQLPELESAVAQLKSLQLAMAKRIETLESELEEAKQRHEKVLVIYKNDTDRWALEEADLKRNVKELQDRLKRRKAEAKKDARDQKLEVMNLRQTVNELQMQLKDFADEETPIVSVAPPRRPGESASSDSGSLTSGSSAPASANTSSSIQRAAPPVREPCKSCGLPIKKGRVQALGNSYHDTCFLCSSCKNSIEGQFYKSDEGELLCRTCRDKDMP